MTNHVRESYPASFEKHPVTYGAGPVCPALTGQFCEHEERFPIDLRLDFMLKVADGVVDCGPAQHQVGNVVIVWFAVHGVFVSLALFELIEKKARALNQQDPGKTRRFGWREEIKPRRGKSRLIDAGQGYIAFVKAALPVGVVLMVFRQRVGTRREPVVSGGFRHAFDCLPIDLIQRYHVVHELLLCYGFAGVLGGPPHFRPPASYGKAWRQGRTSAPFLCRGWLWCPCGYSTGC
nr:MAG TPA: hypothetical protein [Caudoviricetes sp.]